MKLWFIRYNRDKSDFTLICHVDQTFQASKFFLFQPIKLTDKGPIRIRYLRSFPESSKGFCCLTSEISQTKDCHYSFKELYKNQFDSYCMSHKNDIISLQQLTCNPKVIIIPRLYVSSCLSVVKDVLLWLNAVKRG